MTHPVYHAKWHQFWAYLMALLHDIVQKYKKQYIDEYKKQTINEYHDYLSHKTKTINK